MYTIFVKKIVRKLPWETWCIWNWDVLDVFEAFFVCYFWQLNLENINLCDINFCDLVEICGTRYRWAKQQIIYCSYLFVITYEAQSKLSKIIYCILSSLTPSSNMPNTFLFCSSSLDSKKEILSMIPLLSSKQNNANCLQ